MSWCACGFGILHFFHLMNISNLGISDAINGCFCEHTSSDFILFLVHSCPFIYFYTPPLKKCGPLHLYGIHSVSKIECQSICPSITISFPLSVLSTLQPFLFKPYKSWYCGGVVLDHWWVNLLNKHRDIALYVEIGFGAQSWPIISLMNERQYKDLGALRDCKSLNFVKNYRVTALDLKKWWLACIQNNNISGLLNPKHVRIQ